MKRGHYSQRKTQNKLPAIEGTSTTDYESTPQQFKSSSRLLQNQKTNAGIVRSIFDSCYIRPDENPNVIQDDDPVKTAGIQSATKRFEQGLETLRKQKQDYFINVEQRRQDDETRVRA